MNRSNASLGIILVAVAVFLVLGKLGVFTFLVKLLWPALEMAAGLILNYLYFRKTLPDIVLIPGGILVVYSLLFLIGTIFGWETMRILWPGYLFGIAVGLYEWAVYGNGFAPRSVYSSAIVLAVASGLLFVMVIIKANIYILAALLLIVGIFFMLRRSRR